MQYLGAAGPVAIPDQFRDGAAGSPPSSRASSPGTPVGNRRLGRAAGGMGLGNRSASRRRRSTMFVAAGMDPRFRSRPLRAGESRYPRRTGRNRKLVHPTFCTAPDNGGPTSGEWGATWSAEVELPLWNDA